MDLALDNLQRLICHKTHTTNQHQIEIKGIFSATPSNIQIEIQLI